MYIQSKLPLPEIAPCRYCWQWLEVSEMTVKYAGLFGVCPACAKEHGIKALGVPKAYYYDVVAHARRKARIVANGGHHTVREWRALKRHWNYECLACGKREPEIKLSRDHIIPIALGGTDYISNIQPLCLSCNIRKRATYADYRRPYQQLRFAEKRAIYSWVGGSI